MAELLTRIFDRYLTDLSALEEDLFQATALNETLVDQATFRQSSLFAHWATLSSIADDRYRKQKRHIQQQVWPAAIYKAKRQLEKQDERVTHAAAEVIANQDPLYMQATETLAKFGLVLDILKKAEAAMYQKRDMLKGLAFRRFRGENAASTEHPEDREYDRWADRALRKPNLNLSDAELEQAAINTLRRSKNGT